MSLIVVAFALPFRSGTISFQTVLEHLNVILNLLSGSLLGAWVGAGWAIRLKTETFYRLMAILLFSIALLLLFGHTPASHTSSHITGWPQTIIGVAAGFGIGVIASLLGVAGGELLIPTLVLLFGADIKLAGSLSLAVSLPTMLTAFTRYSKDNSFAVLGQNRKFVLTMAFGSLIGVFLGGQLLGIVPEVLLLPMLALILLVSAVKVWPHG
jgi:uncharacterized membrane protein YfcA